MSSWIVAPGPTTSIAVTGQAARFAVHRVYCVGQNYAAHSREMGADPAREPPFFFSKPADSMVESGGTVTYPPRTSDFHHEVELVVALGAGGANVSVSAAQQLVFGYAVGNDLTRRDLQAAAKQAGRPWDTAKGFDQAGVVSAIRAHAAGGHPQQGRIWLKVNGTLRQDGNLSDMIWKIPEIIAELSTYFCLRPGDLIFTGTPAGVGAIERGDRIEAAIEGVGELDHRVD